MAKYHEVWRIDREAQAFVTASKRRKAINSVDVTGMTPSEWLQKQKDEGNAFFCARRSATITKTTCSKLRGKILSRLQRPVYDVSDDESYVKQGICQTCQQHEDKKWNSK